MQLIQRCAAAASIFLTLSLASHQAVAQAITVANIPYAEAASVNGKQLHLNGAGVRYKTVFKVYTAGIYLEKKVHSAQELYALTGPKRLTVTMLRDIDAHELGKLFSRGMEDNMDRTAFSKLVPGVLKMSKIFTDNKKLEAGDKFTVDWIPGTGTIISVKGVPQGEPFKEPEFFQALLGIWLGNNPADWKLKDALLGKAA